LFGDLSKYQKSQGISISSNEVDIICNNCRHKYRFEKKDVEGEGRI
jgi:redox-regulated HSP33 family molecular chaperone